MKLRVLLVDPSLFTAPYDAALTRGLVSAGVTPSWATRGVRDGDRQELPSEFVDAFFYRRVDQFRLPGRLHALIKGVAHFAGLLRLIYKVARERPDVVHVQWVVVPLMDVLAIAAIRMYCPVMLTVHDSVPFNGEAMNWLQRAGFDLPMKLSSGIIVHTHGGRENLERRGVPSSKLSVVKHGPLALPVMPRRGPVSQDDRYTLVLFGELKPYKGIDLLVEAIGRLPIGARDRMRLVIAGRPRMDLQPIQRRLAELRLMSTVEIRPHRLNEQEMVDLFAEANCFVFPYRHIDASGVYFLTQSLGKWIIASRVGIFAEELADGVRGRLVEPNDEAMLAKALEDAIERRPTTEADAPDSNWESIGRQTRDLYLQYAGA